MIGLLYFILCTFGLTQLLCYGKIFDKIRPKASFFRCPMCMGFWIGGFFFLLSSQTNLFNFELSILNFILLSSLSSGTAYVLTVLVGDDGFKVDCSCSKDGSL